MLYDPKWEQKTKEPSLAGLIEWLEGQDPGHSYDWRCCQACLVCDYLKATTGAQQPSFKYIFSAVVGGHDNYHAVAAERPWTYGAALERARKIVRG